MTDLDALQARVGKWGEKTFPHATSTSILEHLLEEADELYASRGTLLLAEEAADVLLLLLHLAHRSGFSLQDAATEKFAACRKRTWAPPDERGVSRHVKG